MVFAISVCCSHNYPPLLKFVNIWLAALLSVAIAFIHFTFFSGTYNWLGNISTGLFFYLMGIKMRDIQFSRISLIVSLLIVAITVITKPVYVSMFSNTVQNDGFYLLWFPFCLGGIVLINNLFKFLCEKNVTFPIIQSIGLNSMTYYLLHFTVPIFICHLFIYRCPQGDKWEFLCYLLISVSLVLPVLCNVFLHNHLSWMVGSNKQFNQ